MKKLFTCILLSLSFSVITKAQSNYKPGYIVNLHNDTVKGFIDYKEWGFNPKTANFKSSLTQKEPEKISLDNTNAFAIINLEYYQKAIVHVSTASIEMASLPSGIDTSYRVDTIFLKVLITGKNASLFSFTDDIKQRFYIEDQENKQQIDELNYYLYIRKNNLITTQTVYQYRTQLETLAAKYEGNDKSLNKKIESTRYAQTDLQKVVGLINGGVNQQTEHKNLFGVSFLVGTGVKYSRLTFLSDQGIQVPGPFPYGAKANSTSPILSGGIDLMFNKNTQVIIFRFEATLSRNHFDIPFTDINVLGGQATLDFKQFNASFVPQVIFNFYSKDNLKIFADAGLAINVSSYNNYYYTTNYDNASVTKANKYPEFSKGWISAPFKLGVVVAKKIEIYGSYTPSAALNNYGQNSGNIISYQAGINYLFGR